MPTFSISRFLPNALRSVQSTSPDPANDVGNGTIADSKPSLDANVAPDEKAQQALESPDDDAQRGVRMVEAVTLTWTKTSLIWVFVKYMTSHVLLTITDPSLACGYFTLSMPFSRRFSVT